MWQWLALDRAGRRSYYRCTWATALLVACVPRPAALAPADLPPVDRDTVATWLTALVPSRSWRYDLRWTYQTQQGTTRGRAAVRLVPPDSLRFDYRAPFGRSGAAVLVGDDVVWSAPEDDVEALIPVAPLFWAAIGIPRLPAGPAALAGRAAGEQRVWRWASGYDTLTFALHQGGGRALAAEMRRAGRLVGRVQTAFADSTGLPTQAQMSFPGAASVFIITVQGIDTLATIDRAVFLEP